MLDLKICESMSLLLDQLTTTGKDILDTKLLKEFLIQAGGSEEYITVCHQKIMQQLEKDHSEIRYGTVLLIEQLFKRSKVYRELLLDDLEQYLELTLETNFNKLLPKPYSAARKLKRKTLQLIQTWNTEFGKEYRQLFTTYTNLRTKLKIDFADALKRTNAEVESARRKEERQKKINESKVEVLKTEISENAEEISKTVTEMGNCFALLIPKPQDLFDASDMKESASETTLEGSTDDPLLNLREHGLGLTRSTITVNVPNNTMNTVQRTEENQIIFDNLRELYSVLKKTFLAKIRTWLKVITKADNLELFKRILDLKQLVQDEITRYEKLRIESGLGELEAESDTDDSDFEEVPDKEDYEEFVKPPPVRVPSPLPCSSQSCTDNSVKKVPEASSWSLWGPIDNNPEDPTTLGARIQNLRKPVVAPMTINDNDHLSNDNPQPSSSKSSTAGQIDSYKELSRKEKLLQKAPKLPYDIDLYHWEDEKLTAPSVELVESDSHRFWQPSDREGEVIEAAEGVAALRTRTIEFTGTFEPVKWACRAPMPNGSLCPRRDRVKCPFHGNIIGRDEFGNPTNPEDIANELEKKAQEEKEKPPDWQDPTYLRDLQAQIGIDLTIKAPKKGRKKKTFAEQYPELTDLAKERNTPRARLAKKVFSRNAMKRVGQALDEVDHKKFRDKFGDQYNYAYNE